MPEADRPSGSPGASQGRKPARRDSADADQPAGGRGAAAEPDATLDGGTRNRAPAVRTRLRRGPELTSSRWAKTRLSRRDKGATRALPDTATADQAALGSDDLAAGRPPAARRPLRAFSRDLPDRRLVVVPPFAVRERLDSFLVRYGGDATRSRGEWQRLIGDEAVLLNGRPSRPSQRVSPGDRVEIAASPPPTPDLTPQSEVPFNVVFADPAMIVLDKPAGVVVHPAPGNEQGTLVNGLLARFPELRDATGDLRPGIVHRLDKDTSGLMVVGRTAAATADLQRQMQDRSTEKRYLLLVRGNIAQDEGLIDAPIARDARHRQRMAVRAGGRASQTRFTVRERFGDFTLVDALLLTGRTHQLRVHFASIGHPVAGDSTYGHLRGVPGLTRQFVHAHRLRLRSPVDQAEHTFDAALPADLAEPLARLRQRGPRRPS